jgi:hypothetical protein
MKIACVIATYKRYFLTLNTIKMLKQQTVPLNIIVVGSNNQDKKLSNIRGCHYIQYKNDPLGEKWQAGVNFAKTLNPDALLICGSDNWLVPSWSATCLKYINEGYDLVGKSVFEVCNILPKQNIEIIRRKTFLPIGS